MADAISLNPYGTRIANALSSALRLIPVTAGDRKATIPSTETTENFSIGTFNSAIFIPNIHYYGQNKIADFTDSFSMEYILALVPNQQLNMFPNPDSMHSYISNGYFGWFTTSTEFSVQYYVSSGSSTSNFLKEVDGVVAVLS